MKRPLPDGTTHLFFTGLELLRMAFTDVITNSDSGCAEKNIQLTDTKMREISGAHLIVWGVDSNEGDYANGGYKDEGDAADLQFTGADRDDLNYSGHRAVGARIYY
jgi:hypothetical protein